MINKIVLYVIVHQDIYTATDLMMVLDKASVIGSQFPSHCVSGFNWITRW